MNIALHFLLCILVWREDPHCNHITIIIEPNARVQKALEDSNFDQFGLSSSSRLRTITDEVLQSDKWRQIGLQGIINRSKKAVCHRCNYPGGRRQ